MRGQRRFRWFGALGVSLLLTTLTALGQTTGSIEGTVSDVSGGVLPGASVEARSASLQGARLTVTERDGGYRFPALPPGPYKLRVTLPSFLTAEKSLAVSLGQTASVNVTLQLGAQESVVVAGEGAPLRYTSIRTGTAYSCSLIGALPGDRNYASIARANPGVSSDRGDRQGRSLALSIYGATSAENQFNIDGANTTNVLKGVQGKALNNEFIQEVEVKTGGYQAEDGRALGGIINVVTKSGGNAFHGDGFLYYDSFGWQAPQKITSEDEVDAQMRVVDYERRDYGADLGGYLLKDRLWFFAAYDRFDLPSEISRVESNDYVSSDQRFPVNSTTSLYSGKLTWNIAPGSSLVASVFSDPTSSSGAGASDPRQGYASVRPNPISYPDPSAWESSRVIGGTDYSLQFTQLFGSQGLLSLQAARHQDRYGLAVSDGVQVVDYRCDGGTLENPCGPPLQPNSVSGGYGRVNWLNNSHSYRDQVRADFNLYLGNHDLKIGGIYQDSKTGATSYFSGGQQVVVFNQYGQTYYEHIFLPRSSEDPTPVGSVTSTSGIHDFGGYLQDSWKPAPGWTVNAGLRWDEENIRSSLLASFIRTSKWQPRLGVIWDPGRVGKTRIFAFAGRFYWELPTDPGLRAGGALRSQGNANTWNFDPVDVTQDPSNPYGNEPVLPPGPFIGEPVDANLKGVYQDELSVGFDQLLDPTLSVGVKATYRRLGNAIEDRCDFNPSPETNFNTCAIVNPGSDGKLARGEAPWCNGLDGGANQCFDTGPATPPARRVYRGIEVLARKTVGERLWVQASYVFSSLRGNFDGAISESSGQTDPGINADFDYAQFSHNGYGRLFLDRPHRLRLDGTYTTPFRLSVGLQAWAVSGAPLDKIGFNSVNYGPRINLVQRGYAGRLPTEWEANLTLSYPIAVGPVTVTLQGYVFNLFNNQIALYQNNIWSHYATEGYPDNLYDPNQQKTNDAYGKITSRQDPRLFRAAIRVSF